MRHLLTHTAGWFGDDFTDTGDGDDALARYVAEMADLPQIAPLGRYFSYNNAAVSLAGRVIEVVTGQTYEAAVSELVLEPLGLDADLLLPRGDHDRGVRGRPRAQVDPSGAPVVLEPWALPRAVNPAGGLVSSVVDQLRYARFHLGDGRMPAGPAGRLVLSQEAMQRMQTPLGPGGTLAA